MCSSDLLVGDPPLAQQGGQLLGLLHVENVCDYTEKALAHGGGCKLILDRRKLDLPEKNRNGFFQPCL